VFNVEWNEYLVHGKSSLHEEHSLCITHDDATISHDGAYAQIRDAKSV